MNSFTMRNFRLPGEVSFVLCVWALKLSQWWVWRLWCSGVWQHDVSYTCDSEGAGSRCLHFTDVCLHQTTWCHMPERHDISSVCLILKTVIVCACNVVINLTIEDTRNKYRIWLKRNHMLDGCGFCAGITTPWRCTHMNVWGHATLLALGDLCSAHRLSQLPLGSPYQVRIVAVPVIFL